MSRQNLGYTPLAAYEQDVIGRMLENQDLYVEVVDWGFHPNPIITAGDKRIQIRFPMQFDRPEGVTIPVYHFKLRLKDRDGNILASTIESTLYNGKPLLITAGMQIDLVWDLALERVDDSVINRILPGIKGTKVATKKDYEK